MVSSIHLKVSGNNAVISHWPCPCHYPSTPDTNSKLFKTPIKIPVTNNKKKFKVCLFENRSSN